MSGLPPELDFPERGDINKKAFDRAFGWIADKFRSLDAFKPDWVAAVDELRAFGLQRINEAILPAYDRVMRLASFGFLMAESQTKLSLAVGDRKVFEVDDESQRDLFTPTAFVTLTRTSAPDDYAVGRVEAYDNESGLLTLVIEAAQISAGEHDDWQITATTGTVTAAIALLADTRAARDEAVLIKQDTIAIRLSTIADVKALKDATFAARDRAEKAAADANTAALLIEGGPVASVNGETGNVKIDVDNLPGLSSRLSAASEEVSLLVSQRLSIVVKQTLTAAQRLIGLENLGISAGMLVPTGTVCYFYGSQAPMGWLKINGALLLRADFPELVSFAKASGCLVSEAEWQAGARGCFSDGDGVTTIRLPDARGEFLRAWADGAGVDAGRSLGSNQAGAIQSHVHTGRTAAGGDHTQSYGLMQNNGDILHTVAAGPYTIKTGFNPRHDWPQTGSSGPHVHDFTTNATGSSETRPRNIALLAIIKY